ncbi:MAG TPA: hypothetical protein VKB35_07655 [Ktedonobacteraceae bacterium]|nr:hypothetical protein [Ktedonobacteraceae bacterium]
MSNAAWFRSANELRPYIYLQVSQTIVSANRRPGKNPTRIENHEIIDIAFATHYTGRG